MNGFGLFFALFFALWGKEEGLLAIFEWREEMVRRVGIVSRVISSVIVMLMLSGCGAATGWVLAGGAVVTVGSLMMTKKLPNDVIAERQTGLECDTVYGLRNGTEICRAKKEDRIEEGAESYCYRSIGNIVCYATPDPSYEEVEDSHSRGLSER